MSEFTISYTDTEEITHLRQGFADTLCVRRARNGIGTLLLDMLNCDIQALEETIKGKSKQSPWEQPESDEYIQE